ncbi:unnamed protein product [Ranitomeya imitator]|uniref:Uncharacterized protein n=1 Tax=Ranitomeya imitator TaxID=111125 RepID=A0ABN9L980_9NEOB|nr:unnamed protein product [Ranitomeya imitator]
MEPQPDSREDTGWSFFSLPYLGHVPEYRTPCAFCYSSNVAALKYGKTGALKKDYQDNVFGQHLVELVVLKAVPDFLNNPNPKKPLVLSFHGWTGGGKNHVSQTLVRNIYPRVDKRKKCVQSFDVAYHFSQEENIVKEMLKQRIYETVKECERAIFIFDEMDKMPPGLIDVIKPYLDYYEELDGLSFRKCIFIFLSNTGGEKLTELAIEFWRNHKEREDIKLSDVESHLSRHAFNKKNVMGHELSKECDKNAKE